jgi:signal transduction histidine kinase
MEWKKSLVPLKQRILLLISTGSILGYISDIILLNSYYLNEIFNLISIIVTLIATLALFLKIFSIQLSSAIIVYTLLFNIIISNYYGLSKIDCYEANILRSVVVFGLLMTVAGFVNGRNHLLIIGCFSILWFISVLIISQNDYLMNNAGVIFIVIFSSTFGLYYLFRLIEESISTKNNLIIKLSDKSHELEISNKMLSQEKSVSEARRNELKSLIETKEKLFSIISHDIKNPLSAIIGFTDLIQSNIEVNDLQKVSEFTAVINTSSINLYRLLNNLLDWTKMQSGRLIVFPELADVNLLISESIELFSSFLENKQIKLERDLLDNDGIYADINMLSTIFRNLFSNAIKYTQKGGTIKIHSRVEDNNYIFSVSDTGIGMNSDVLDRLMNNNEGFSTTGTNGEKGTGFGILLCKEFIDLHHGKLIISSEINKGSVFTIQLPANYSVKANT